MTEEIKTVSSYLSKSLFIRGCQCHKSLWLKKHRPELLEELSPEQENLFATGFVVGDLAKELFPGGAEVPYDGLSHDEQVQMTRQLMAGGVTTIYEATFCYDEVFCKADILHLGKDGWELFEVKASTRVKDYQLKDAALQLRVLRGAGINPVRAAIVHINNGYVRQGDLDLQQLFTVADVTAEVEELQPFVAAEISGQRAMLQEEEPDIPIGPQCSSPFECDFEKYCWPTLPEDSVFELRGRGVDRFALYHEGIIKQEDIPLDRLNSSQRFQVESTLNQRDHIDKNAVQEFVDDLWYPLCFLDFETFMAAVPPFDGCRPYQKIPFQYSLHIQETPDAELKHYEYLVEPGKDPRRALFDNLLELIPENACIVAWNQSFEIKVLEGLAEYFIDTQEKIERMIENFRDLMVPFRNRDIYPWQAKGSYSIKPILPLLAPELSYESLTGVADGGDAMEAYHAMSAMEDPAEVAQIRSELLEYCKLDTLAMVRILERMREM